MGETIEEFKSFIENHDFFFIAGHKEPDGDCITSCLGIAAILDHFGKPYQLLSAGPFKRNEVIRWQDKFSDTMEFQDQEERNKSGLFIADCSELIRLGTGEKRDYDTTKTLIDLFRVQAERTPDAVAVVDKDSQYSYQELDIESNILANILIEEGINAGDHVCVELPRRKEFLLAVFGIMKAGAAYVPIDMDYPDERKSTERRR